MTFTITLLLALQTILGTNCAVEEARNPKADEFYSALVKVPSFFTAQPCESAVTLHVDVFEARLASRKIAEIRWVEIGQPNASYCLPVVFEPGKTCPRGVAPAAEDGYEERAFVAVERSGSSARIRLDTGTGWIRLSKADELVGYEDLVEGRMAELTPAWDGRVFVRPGGRLRTIVRKQRSPVTVVQSKRMQGQLWFQVRVLAVSPCESHEPQVLAAGWIHAYSSSRRPAVRHFSRGC
jgi:hypothetical protein